MVRAVVPQGTPLEYVDHRFFQKKKEVGSYACGIVRNAVTKEINSQGTYFFRPGNVSITVAGFTDFLYNPPVAAFFMERSVLASISDNGLKCLKIAGRCDRVFFDDFIGCNTALYVPKSYACSAIDAIFVVSDPSKWTAWIYPIKIAVMEQLEQSEQLFMDNWQRWVRPFQKYHIHTTFVWITPHAKGYSTESRKEKCKIAEKGRSGEMIHPAYETVYVALEKVDPEMWKIYDRYIKHDKL